MKKTNSAIFFFAFVFCFLSCKDENPHVRKNDDGTIKYEVYKLENSRDSSVDYSYYRNKAKRSIYIRVDKNGKAIYNEECRYDSVTGQLQREIYFDSTGNILREWSWVLDDELNKFVTRETFGRLRDGRQCDLTIYKNSKVPVKIIYTAYNDPVSKLQRYDSLGIIDRVALFHIGSANDTLIQYNTPELKAGFHDTLLEMANEMKKRIIFPGKNK